MEKLMDLMPKLFFVCHKALENKYESLDLTHQQAKILYSIYYHKNAIQKKLCDTTFIEPPTLSRNIDALVQKGLAQRSVDPQSRRSFNIELTPGGETAVKKIIDIIDSVEKDLLSYISPREKDSLINIINKIVKGGMND